MLWDKCLILDMATTKEIPFDKVFQSSTCWWNPLHRGHFCKELHLSFVRISAGASLVPHMINNNAYILLYLLVQVPYLCVLHQLILGTVFRPQLDIRTACNLHSGACRFHNLFNYRD